MPPRVSRSLTRAARALQRGAYRSRSVLELDARAREYACREEFFFNAFKALSFNGIQGDYCEFGSHGCVTFRFAYQQSRRFGHRAKLWAFDSFAGFPESVGARDDHPKWKTGGMAFSLEDFKKTCGQFGIATSEYEVVPGFYEQSLATFAEGDAPQDICLAYIDCDMYSSTKTVLDFLRPRLKHGMIIAFDDYHCWSVTHPSGERQAMLEAFPDDGPWELVPYQTYGWAGASFVLESRSSASRT
jgi:O-methyltransferase